MILRTSTRAIVELSPPFPYAHIRGSHLGYLKRHHRGITSSLNLHSSGDLAKTCREKQDCPL